MHAARPPAAGPGPAAARPQCSNSAGPGPPPCGSPSSLQDRARAGQPGDGTLAASPASLNLVHAVSLPSLLAFERSQPENQEGTMLRLFVVALLLAIGLVIPAAAELNSEHEARQ